MRPLLRLVLVCGATALLFTVGDLAVRLSARVPVAATSRPAGNVPVAEQAGTRIPLDVSHLAVSDEPHQVEDVVELQGVGDGPGRHEVCTTTCETSGDTKTTTTVCTPFVDPESASARLRSEIVQRPSVAARAERLQPAPAPADQKSAFTPSDRFLRLEAGKIALQTVTKGCAAASMPTTMSRTVEPRSPYCWVSALAYCRYNPNGRVGYPCNCGSRAGHFD